MRNFLDSVKAQLKKANERDRKLEQPIEHLSRLIWPWRESRLIILVSALALLDFISTVTALNQSSRYGAREVGIFAKWAFNLGGFPGLFLVYTAAIGALVLFATAVRALFRRLGFAGFGRSAFVFLFVPYSVIIVPVIINNFFITFVR